MILHKKFKLNPIKIEGVTAIFMILYFSNFLWRFLFCNLLGAKGPQKDLQGLGGPSGGLWPPVDYKIETSIKIRKMYNNENRHQAFNFDQIELKLFV